ncbi:PLxRFG domain-containing protein [Comamonas sp. CMM02]|uniref:PLxRFG domain-containing protein n=1 Tax=Comamonas sp. CMM02 TaxID=2769307 RepID=UPI001CE17639|nr:PLxRFG domain-containing protein [Comamonas sp. CMM02]
MALLRGPGRDSNRHDRCCGPSSPSGFSFLGTAPHPRIQPQGWTLRGLSRIALVCPKRGNKYEPDLAHALRMAEDDGVVSPQEIHQLMAQARGAGGLRTGDGTKLGDARAAASNAWEKGKVAWGQPFALAEQFNRRSTFIAAYRLARDNGMDSPAQFARDAVVETQFLYTKANKPQWARGAVGGTLFTFKTYSVSFLELMQRTWNAGEAGSPERAAGRRAVGWAMLMLMLMGGAGGMPFVEDVEDLVDGVGQMMGYNLSSKQWRKDLMREVLGAELAEFMDSGLSGMPGAPIDVSGRLGMGNLIPGTGLLLSKQSNTRDVVEMMGPAGDLVARGFSGAKSVVSGVINRDAASIGRGAMEVMPNAVRNAAKGADMAASGIYKDTKGYKVVDTSLDEALWKAIGFQPRSVAEVQESNSFMQRAKSFYTQTSNDIRAQWGKALFEKDEAGVVRVRERLAQWNAQNPDQPIRINMPDIWKRARQMGKDRTARIADTAPTAIRQQMRDYAARE